MNDNEAEKSSSMIKLLKHEEDSVFSLISKENLKERDKEIEKEILLNKIKASEDSDEAVSFRADRGHLYINKKGSSLDSSKKELISNIKKKSERRFTTFKSLKGIKTAKTLSDYRQKLQNTYIQRNKLKLESQFVFQHNRELVNQKFVELNSELIEKFKDDHSNDNNIYNGSGRNSNSHVLETQEGKKITKEELWEKMIKVKELVKQKTEDEFSEIMCDINDGNKVNVLAKLLDPAFKRFYKLDIPKSGFLIEMVECLEFDMLTEVLRDPMYKFDEKFIFTYIINEIKGIKSDMKNNLYNNVSSHYYPKKDVNETDNEKHQFNVPQIILTNLTKYELYPKDNCSLMIISYFLSDFEYFEAFRNIIKSNEDFFQEHNQKFNNFEGEQDIVNFSKDTAIFEEVVHSCLENDYENIAINLFLFNPESFDKKLIIKAAETDNIELLRSIWEYQNETTMDKKVLKSRSSIGINSSRVHKTNSKSYKFSFSFGTFNISEVIPILSKNPTSLKNVLKWDYLENDEKFLDNLIENNCFDEVSDLIAKKRIHNWKLKHEHFLHVIEKDQTELILFFVKFRECRVVLLSEPTQKLIVNKYMRYGDKLYYGAEMLVYIYKNQWYSNLTKSLCKAITRTLKTKDILNCHSPILSCLLLIEFLDQIKQISISHKSRCEKVSLELKLYCKHIQESNPEENYIRYLMKQKDSKGRSAFQIASENFVYELLETAEVGTIVKKMWNGNLSNNGFFAASSMHRYLDNEIKTMDPFYSFDKLDTEKIYFFQFAVWTDSCSLRYWPESLSTVGLIVTYNIFIYLLVRKGQMMNSYNQLDPLLKSLLSVYILWVASIVLGIINMWIFCYKTKRKFKFDMWTYIELLLFVFSLLTLLDTRNIFDAYKSVELSEVIFGITAYLEIPFTNVLSTEAAFYSGTLSFITRTVILSINEILVWMRVTGILLTFKEMGPVIRMIFKMTILLLKYILIIALFLACSAAIFTALFNKYSDMYKDFTTSVMTLFGGFVSQLGADSFDPKILVFGQVMTIIYICLAGILFINLLIAVLSSVFDDLSKVVDASHRAVLINYYRKYKWHEKYGYLIFLTSPISMINFALMLISYCCGFSRKIFNSAVSKIYFFIFYFPFIFAIYICYSLLILPFCYFKGMVLMIRYQRLLKIPKAFKIINVLKWMFGGIFYLFFIYFRDIYCIFNSVYIDVKRKVSDIERIKENISTDEVVIFLKFIHSRTEKDSKDIHTLFMNYLEYEAEEKAELDEKLKEKKNYLKKLNSAAFDHLNQVKLDTKTVGIYNKGGNIRATISSAFIKKNLMVIEILENFLIEDEMNGAIVDIPKMKKLLPKTMQIKNYHLKRLIYSDINALSQAMTKLKVSKNIFLQYQLVNKIIATAKRLDKDMDAEIFKIQRLRNNMKDKLENAEEKEKSEENVANDLEMMTRFEKIIGSLLKETNRIIQVSKRENKSVNDGGSMLSDEIKSND